MSIPLTLGLPGSNDNAGNHIGYQVVADGDEIQLQLAILKQIIHPDFQRNAQPDKQANRKPSQPSCLTAKR